MPADNPAMDPPMIATFSGCAFAWSAFTILQWSVGFGQITMNKRYRHGTFTHRRRDSLDRTVSHVARRERSGNARLEKERRPRQRPARRVAAVDQQVRSRNQISSGIAHDRSVLCPLRVRGTADAIKRRRVFTFSFSSVARFVI